MYIFYEYIFPYQVFNATGNKQAPVQMNVDTLDPTTKPQTQHPSPIAPPTS